MDVAVNTPSTPLRAGLRSLVLPGWGQLATAHRFSGWLLILASLALAAAVAAVVVSWGTVETLARLADPDVLLALLIANLILAVARLASTGHAWWAGGGRGWFTGVSLAVLVLVPHVAVAWVGGEARDTLLQVFSPPSPQPPAEVAAFPASSVPSTTSIPTTTTSVTTTTVPEPATRATLPLTPDVTPPTAPPTTLPFHGDRLTVLLLGGDAGPGRSGLRTDTVMVASFDPVTADAALVGLPRNYTNLFLSDGTELEGLIFNEVYQWGRDHPERFQGVDPGAAAVVDVAEQLTGLEIDHFMLVDLTGYAAVMDAFGGVTLTVPRAVYGPLYDTETGSYEMITIPTGRQTLSGAEALAYSRARLNTNDYDRMGRQRCVLAAMAAEANPVDLLTSLPELLDTVEAHLTTDLPLDVVPDLIRLLPEVAGGEIRVIGFDHTWTTGRTQDRYPIPDVERIRAAVRQIIENPEESPAAPVSRACG